MYCQDNGYSIHISQLKGSNEFSGRVFNDKPVTDATVDKALFTIHGVKESDIVDIKIVYKETGAAIAPKFNATDSTLVYSLGREIGPAKNEFNLLYKDSLNGFIQFDNQLTAAGAVQPDGGGDTPPKEEDDLTSYLSALTTANFVGNNKFLSNFTPSVNLGSIIDLATKRFGKLVKDEAGDEQKRGLFAWRLDINPYLGAQIDTKDSVSFIPALMLGGRAGLSLNNYLSWGNENVEFTWMPFGFGLKIIPDLKDSAVNIWQHNFRTGVSLKYKEDFIIGTQFTYGFHNTTSQSKEFYQQVFSKSSTDIKYLTISGQFFVKSKNENTRNSYLFVEWRGLLSSKSYPGFTNKDIITVGFRKDLALTNTFATAASTTRAASSGRKITTHKKRPSLF
jgi:hypothetical protein